MCVFVCVCVFVRVCVCLCVCVRERESNSELAGSVKSNCQKSRTVSFSGPWNQIAKIVAIKRASLAKQPGHHGMHCFVFLCFAEAAVDNCSFNSRSSTGSAAHTKPVKHLFVQITADSVFLVALFLIEDMDTNRCLQV